MKKIILLSLIILWCYHCFAQVNQEWVARYNGPGNSADYAISIKVDGLGNAYVTGFSTGGVTGDDFATVKYNSSGVQQWVSTFNGSGNSEDHPTSLAIDDLGNVYVTGYAVLTGTGYDYVTIKYNSTGVQQWMSPYNNTLNYTDQASSIAVDGAGNVYVTGSSASITSDNYDYATIKYNSSGVQQWVSRVNGAFNLADYARSIAVDGSGNVYVTGRTSQTPFGSYHATTIQYNSSGGQQWSRIYSFNGSDGKSVVVDSLGNAYIISLGPFGNYVTIKYNSLGVQQWSQGSGNSNEYANSIALDGSGYIYETGTSTGLQNYITTKYNPNGDSIWVMRYNGPDNQNDRANSIAIDRFNNVYTTGESRGSSTQEDYATVRYHHSGFQQWVQRYSGPTVNSDIATSIALDNSGNVYITGRSYGEGTNNFDYATIKYSQSIGIQPISNELPSEYKLYQNYPNPFNPVTSINFSITKLGFVKLIVYNIFGKEIETLVNEQLKAGIYKAEFDGSNLSSGIYFCKLETNDFIDTKKMFLVK